MKPEILIPAALVPLADVGLVLLASTVVYFVVRWGLLRAVRRLVERSSPRTSPDAPDRAKLT